MTLPGTDPRARIALLLGLTGLAYLNSFAAVPQFDDWVAIFDAPAVASLEAWWQGMPGMRPLLKLSYALNMMLGGVAGFHLVNLLVHGANVVLVHALLLVLLPAHNRDAAFVGALLFALHPVNTEAVTMLSGRSVSLAALCMLGSIVAQLKGRAGLSLLLFALGLAVRETAMVLPALLALCVFQRASRGSAGGALRGRFAAALHETRWHWLLACAGLLAVLALPRYRELLQFSLATRAPLDNLVTQALATLYLFGQLLQPFALNPDPRLAVFAGWEPRWVVAALLWSAALAWALARVGRGSWAAFTVLWCALALAPTNGLVARLDVANERQLYLAAIPLYALLGLAWDRVWLGSHRPGRAIIGMLAGILLAATVLRNADYRSETAFWRAALEVDPGNARAWNNLGFAIERERSDDLAAALAAYDRAIALDPRNYKPRHNREQLCARFPGEPGCANAIR